MRGSWQKQPFTTKFPEKYETFFWRDKAQHEIDLVAKTPGKTLPIEVKYRNEITSSDVNNMQLFMREKNLQGLIITKNTYRQEGGITLMPAWLFCLASH